MKLVVISPEHDHPREHAVLGELFAAGLERYHLRKPYASSAEIEAWIEGVPAQWRSRFVLHQHHELVAKHGLGGYHWRDETVGPISADPRIDAGRERAEARPTITSHSCHDLATLRAALGRFDSVFFGPVFDSISKPGYGPKDASIGEALGALLHTRPTAERRTNVLALGGITVATISRVAALGFDGVAVLGAIWQAADPIAAFSELHLHAVRRGLRSAPVVESAGNGVSALPGSGRRPDGQSHPVAVGTTAAAS